MATTSALRSIHSVQLTEGFCSSKLPVTTLKTDVHHAIHLRLDMPDIPKSFVTNLRAYVFPWFEAGLKRPEQKPSDRMSYVERYLMLRQNLGRRDGSDDDMIQKLSIFNCSVTLLPQSQRQWIQVMNFQIPATRNKNEAHEQFKIQIIHVFLFCFMTF